MVQEYHPRIYERDVNDDDFLMLSIGTANEKSEYTVSLDYDVLATEKMNCLMRQKKYIMNIK